MTHDVLTGIILGFHLGNDRRLLAGREPQNSRGGIEGRPVVGEMWQIHPFTNPLDERLADVWFREVNESFCPE
jgi:hypothetical protein